MLQRIALFFFFLCCSLCNKVQAQDPVFMLYNNAPSQINPALTGLSKAPKLSLNYQNRWAGIENGFNTISAEFSQFFSKARSGIGVSLMSDRAGAGAYTMTQVGLYYAYEIRFSEKAYIRTGFEGKVLHHSLNPNKLVFYDQLNLNGTVAANSAFTPTINTLTYADFGTGLILQTPYFYTGISLHHMNSIRQGFLKDAVDASDILPGRISFTAGSSIDLHPNKPRTFLLNPAILFSKQGAFSLIQTEIQVAYNFFLTGIAFKHTISTTDAVIVSAGFQKGIVKLLYGYGIDLSPIAAYSGGTHEIALCFNWELAKKYKENRYNDCLKIFR